MKASVKIASVLTLIPFLAFADGFEDNTIDALHFHNAADQYYFSLSALGSLHNSGLATQSDVSTYNFSRSSTQSTASLTYGLSDTLQFALADSYSFGNGNTTINETRQTISSTVTSGQSDPTLTINYRVSGGLKGSSFTSVYLSLTPVLQTHQNGEPGSPGNNLASSPTAILGANFYWLGGAHEFAVEPSFQYWDKGVNGDSIDTNSTLTGSYSQAALAGVYRYHFGGSSFLQLAERYYASDTINYNYINRYPNFQTATVTNAYINSTLLFGWKLSETKLLTLAATAGTYTQDSTPANGTAPTHYAQDVENLNIQMNWLF